MIIGFVIWSIAAAIFVGIGIGCRRARMAAGFFTFTKPPVIKDIGAYNHAVSVLWFVSAILLEIIGIPILFLEQDHPLFLLVILAVVLLVIAMMVVYSRIEARYRVR